MIALDGFGFLGPISGGAPITPPGLLAGKRTVYTAVLLKNGRLFNYRAADVDPETRADLERSKARGEVAQYVNFYEVSDERAAEYAKSLRAQQEKANKGSSGVFASIFRDSKATKTAAGLVRIGANAAKTAIASRGGKIALVAVAVGAVAAVGFYVMKKRKGGIQ